MDQLVEWSEAPNSESIVVYFGTNDEDPELEIYQKVVKEIDHILFYHTFASEARKRLDIDDNVKIALFKLFDEKRNLFSGEFTAENVRDFIETNSLRHILPFDDKAA